MATGSKWTLSADGFDKLLDALCPNRKLAGEQYETVRAGLLRFFARRVGGAADALVDETIDRVCRRMEEGEQLEHVGAFFHGVARNVLLEYVKQERRRELLRYQAARESDVPFGDAPHEYGDSERLACLSHCLGTLSIAERDLVEQYYTPCAGDNRTMRAGRAELAKRLGLSPATLRVRAFRLRQRLERCCRQRSSFGARGIGPETRA